jgi:hypothetical protein
MCDGRTITGQTAPTGLGGPDLSPPGKGSGAATCRPYLARQMLEEISSRVAECTRLILVKNGFGEDLGALDR